MATINSGGSREYGPRRCTGTVSEFICCHDQLRLLSGVVFYALSSPKNRLSAGLSQDPMGELTALSPDVRDKLRGRFAANGGGGRKWMEGKEGKSRSYATRVGLHQLNRLGMIDFSGGRGHFHEY